MKEKCYYCDQPAEFYCDFVLAASPLPPCSSIEEYVAAIGKDRAIKTCDRPLCPAHRVNRGHNHICRRSGKDRGCHVESIDYCPGHAGVPDGGTSRFNPVGGGRAS